jgi:hypothetical protein
MSAPIVRRTLMLVVLGFGLLFAVNAVVGVTNFGIVALVLTLIIALSMVA